MPQDSEIIATKSGSGTVYLFDPRKEVKPDTTSAHQVLACSQLCGHWVAEVSMLVFALLRRWIFARAGPNLVAYEFKQQPEVRSQGLVAGWWYKELFAKWGEVLRGWVGGWVSAGQVLAWVGGWATFAPPPPP